MKIFLILALYLMSGCDPITLDITITEQNSCDKLTGSWHDSRNTVTIAGDSIIFLSYDSNTYHTIRFTQLSYECNNGIAFYTGTYDGDIPDHNLQYKYHLDATFFVMDDSILYVSGFINQEIKVGEESGSVSNDFVCNLIRE